MEHEKIKDAFDQYKAMSPAGDALATLVKRETKADGVVEAAYIRGIQESVRAILAQHPHLASKINMQALNQSPDSLISDPNGMESLRAAIEDIKKNAESNGVDEAGGVLSAAAKIAGWTYDKLFGESDRDEHKDHKDVSKIAHAKFGKKLDKNKLAEHKEEHFAGLGDLNAPNLPMIARNFKANQPEIFSEVG